MTFHKLALAAPVVLALALSACDTAEGYRQQMATWQGRIADDLVIEWGAPQEKSTLSDGRQVWTYNRSSVEQQAGYYRDEQRQVKRVIHRQGRQAEDRDDHRDLSRAGSRRRPTPALCTTRFVLSPEQRVEDVRFEGNACLAEER